jgi:hypothetical protein
MAPQLGQATTSAPVRRSDGFRATISWIVRGDNRACSGRWADPAAEVHPLPARQPDHYVRRQEPRIGRQQDGFGRRIQGGIAGANGDRLDTRTTASRRERSRTARSSRPFSVTQPSYGFGRDGGGKATRGCSHRLPRQSVGPHNPVSASERSIQIAGANGIVIWLRIRSDRQKLRSQHFDFLADGRRVFEKRQ